MKYPLTLTLSHQGAREKEFPPLEKGVRGI